MTNCAEHRVRVAEDTHLELVAPDGTVLLATQDVSVQTLVDLVAAHKEGRPYVPRGKSR
jgi:hypothetical protein